MSFTALQVTESAPKQFTHALVRREIDDLPGPDTLIRVQWSSLNYKDALSVAGNTGITHS